MRICIFISGLKGLSPNSGKHLWRIVRRTCMLILGLEGLNVTFFSVDYKYCLLLFRDTLARRTSAATWKCRNA